MNSSKNNTPFILSGSIIVLCVVLIIFLATGGKEITQKFNKKIKTNITSQKSIDNNETPKKSTVSDKNDTKPNETSDKKNETVEISEPKDQSVLDIISHMSDEQKAAQLFIVSMDNLTDVFAATIPGETTKKSLEKYPVGGLIYEYQNIINKNQVQNLLKKTDEFSMENIGLPVFDIIEDFGGASSPITSNPNYNMSVISSPKESKGSLSSEVKSNAQRIASYLKEMGFDMNLAPSGALSDDDSSFGTDSSQVSSRVLEFSKGLKDNNIIPIFRQFPGYGKDRHLDGSIFTSDLDINSLMAEEMLPYSNNISNMELLQFNECAYPDITASNMPCFMSEKMVSEILKKELGYKGIIITPSLSSPSLNSTYSDEEMSVLSIIAGCDMICEPDDLPKAHQAILSAINSGRISEERLNDCLYKIISIKLKGMN